MDVSLKEKTDSIIERLSQNLTISEILREYSKLDRARNSKWQLTVKERDILDKTYRAIDAALEKAKAAQHQKLTKTQKQSTTYFLDRFGKTPTSVKKAAWDMIHDQGLSQKITGAGAKETKSTTRVPDFNSSAEYPRNLCLQTAVPSFSMIPVNVISMSSQPQNRPQTQDTATSGSYSRFGSDNSPFGYTAHDLPYSSPSQLKCLSSTSNCLKKPSVPPCFEHQSQYLPRQKRFRVIERPTEASQSQAVSENDRIVELVAKLVESQIKEEELRKQEKENNRNLENISQRLDFTTSALRTEENVAKMQAKEIYMLRKANYQLNKKTMDLKAETGNVYLTLEKETELVDRQSLEIADLKSRYYAAQRENEEWRRKYQSYTQQDALSMEQIQNALKTVLINNDLIIENLKGIQTDPEEKKKLMVGHNETYRLLRDQEELNQRVRELEEQLRANEDLELRDYDFCDAVDDSF